MRSALPRSRRTVTAWLAIAAVLFVACGGNRESETAIGLFHVDAFALNPADGLVYAATHGGLARLDGLGATRLSADVPDFASVVVVGPDHFLVGGHPDLLQAGEGRPLLGILESTDGGRSWDEKAFGGEADFHVLRVIDDVRFVAAGEANDPMNSKVLFAYDSISAFLLASRDLGATWERRSRVALVDFVVRPDDAETLVAVSGESLLRSRDGGRTWAASEGAGLRLLAWERPERLWGVGTGDVMLLSSDGAATWDERGRAPEAVSALFAVDGSLYIGAPGGRIHVSNDAGGSWDLLYGDD